jgi:hypothetical protein
MWWLIVWFQNSCQIYIFITVFTKAWNWNLSWLINSTSPKHLFWDTLWYYISVRFEVCQLVSSIEISSWENLCLHLLRLTNAGMDSHRHITLHWTLKKCGVRVKLVSSALGWCSFFFFLQWGPLVNTVTLKFDEFLEQLSNYQLFKKDYILWPSFLISHLLHTFQMCPIWLFPPTHSRLRVQSMRQLIT